MRRGAQVTLISSERDPIAEAVQPTRLPIRRWTETGLLDRLARDFDVVVGNFGDNYPFHAGVLEALDHAPVLGIFHDFYLHNLFNGWREAQGLDAEQSAAVIATTYGDEVRAEADRAIRGELKLEALAERFPMTEWAAARCAGALAHADFYVERLVRSCPGPVSRARMPVAPRDLPKVRQRAAGRVRMLTVGVMNPNKCVDLAIRALGRDAALRDEIDYRLAGPIADEERARLTAIAAKVGYERLQILGAVEDAALDREIATADIICCLRKPVLEGSSGSAIEGLLSGRPVIVANAGFYGELPDDLVRKVPARIPVAALSSAIGDLAADAPARRRLGEQARAWALEAFSLDRYLDELEAVMAASQVSRPWLPVAARIGSELAGLGLSEGDPALERIAGRLQALISSA